MWRILLKAVPKNLRRDFWTYLLMGLLVAAGMYIASAFAGLSYSYIAAGEANDILSNREDGQFQVTAPLSRQEEQAITQRGYTLERAFYFDTEQEDGTILRVMKTRQSVDRIILDDGTLPQSAGEAVAEKCYAYHHELQTSDTVRVAGTDLRISGIGSVTDYDSPSVGMNDFSSNSETFGIVFVTEEDYRQLLAKLGSDTREIYVYAYRLAEEAEDSDLQELIVKDLGLLPRLVTFVPLENNVRMGSARSDNYPYGFVGLVTGIGLLVLISLVFFLRIQYSLDQQSRSIGALLAMGVKKRDIFPMLLLPFALVAFAGGLAGFGLSRVFTLEEMGGATRYYSIPEVPMITHPLIFLYCAVMPPVVCTLVNLMLIRKKIAQPVVSLLTSSGEGKKGGTKGIIAAMAVGSLIAATIFMAGRGVGLYCTTVKERLPEEIRYGYVYELGGEQTECPAGAHGAYRYTFSTEDHGYIRDIQFLGVEDGNPYFGAQVAELDGGVVISSAVATRFGLRPGDTLEVTDPLTMEPHRFDIRGVTDYSLMLTVFMEIGDLRAYLQKDGIAYNTFYSDTPLPFRKDQLFSSATKEELISPLEALEPEVQSSRNLFCLLAVLFYSVMIIYLVQFIVVRSRRDIACLSAFGYRAGEQLRFAADRLIAVACISGAVCLFLGYRISLLAMPYLIAATPIALMIDYHLPEYLVHFAGMLVIILAAVLLGLKRVAGTDSLYYLRSRE